jgi:hypothetical protein
MSKRYEVTRWDGASMFPVGECATFTEARELAETHDKARASTMLVFDNQNKGVEVWRVAPAPRGDIACHKVAAPTASPPYAWCNGSPTRAACASRGFCNRNPSCGS